MKNDYLIYGLLGVAVLVLIYTVYTLTISPAVPEIKNSNFKTITSGSTDPGSAQIDLTPIGVDNGMLKVDFAINTHSVDLSQHDLKEITILEFEGKKLAPVSAPLLQGHHNSGTLVFNVGKEINKFKITIAGIPNVQERVFEWK